MADERLRSLVGATEHDVARGHEWLERVVRYDNHRVVTMDNSELLDRDLLDRVAEHVGVLSATFVSRTTRERTTFVASCRPPTPASTTATSTRACANESKAAAVIDSNCVAPTRSAAGRMRASAAGRSAAMPSILIRSLHDRTCGESVAPTDASPSSSCSIVTVDLPLVSPPCGR